MHASGLITALAAGVLLLAPLPAEESAGRWAQEVEAIEARWKAAGVERARVVFTGSSSIRLWDLDKSFPGLQAVNAGFGGSTIAENTRYLDRLVVPLQPEVVVLYAGDNDIANGLTPEQVAADFSRWWIVLREKLPSVRVIFLSIKPSPSRWKLWPQASRANDLIRELIASGEGAVYADVAAPLLSEGRPVARFFQRDELHLAEEGYGRWREVLEPLLSPQ